MEHTPPRSQPSTAAVAARMSRTWLWSALLATLGLVAYHNTFSNPFIFDDHPAIETNATIKSLWSALVPPSEGSSVTGRPVVNLSLALNYHLGGLAVGGYHVFNFLVHLLAGLALFGVARRMLESEPLRERYGRDRNALAAMIAALWLVHPLQTESVTFIVQRTESLMGLFYLLTFYCFVRAVESSVRNLWLALAVTACGLGMATKEVMVSAPLLVLLYDRTFVAGSFRAAWSQRRAFYSALAATWLVVIPLVSNQRGVRSDASGFDPAINPWTYLLTSCRAIGIYLKLTIWPHPLIVDYGTAVVRHLGEVWVQGAWLCGGLTAMTVGVWRNAPWAFWVAWFFAILAPSSSVVPLPAQVIAEHRMYLPLAALVFGGVLGAHTIMHRRGFFVAATLMLVFSTLTARRNSDYCTEEAIWRDTIAKLPESWRAHYNLGWVHEAQRHDPACIPDYEASLKLRPDFVKAHTGLAGVLLATGRTDEAVVHARHALRIQPNNPAAHCIVGLVEIHSGHLPEAINHLEFALRQNPSDEDALASHGNLGIALFQLGKVHEAIEHFNATLRLRPNDPQTHRWLGAAWARLGRMAEAARHFEACLQLDPNDAVAREQLAQLKSPISGATQR